jgi:hypothetical protein
MQEMWGGKIKQRDRGLADFWSESSQHQKRGQHNEVRCKSLWATRVAVIMDAPYALIVLAKGVPGLGVLVPVHMAQRKEEQKYGEQLLAIQAAIHNHPSIWIIIRGEWNRDIRTHATSQRILEQMGVGVVPMDENVHLPKDFVAYRGIKAPQQGQWLEKVGDHPIVWAPTQACRQPHESGVQTKPVVKNKWTEGGEKMVSDLLEAVSRSHCTVQVWLEQYRELMLHVNRATSRGEQDNTSNIVAPQQIMNWKVLVQGRAGKLATDSVAARANQYWASAVRNWTRISGVSLDSATMQIIQ